MPTYVDIPNEQRTQTAQGPMAKQARQAYDKERGNLAREYDIELAALKEQGLPREQFQRKVATLRGKYSLKANQMQQGWDQRQTQIAQYEKLQDAGTISPEESMRKSYALSGYNIDRQTNKSSDLREEHRKIIDEKKRLEEMLWPYARKEKFWGKGEKGPYRMVESLKDGQPDDLGRKVTKDEQSRIDMIKERLADLDQAEFGLVSQMDPRGRMVNQLNRAAGMPPRITGTPGVGGQRGGIPLGKAGPDSGELPRVKTKLTKQEAASLARQRMPSADRAQLKKFAQMIYERGY
jgi:hypothetical protein